MVVSLAEIKYKSNIKIMKRVLVLLVSILFITSCHNDDDHSHDIVFPCADVRLNVDASTNVGRSVDVNRDDIPATVGAIDVTVTSLLTPIVREENYVMVDDNSGENGFVIEQVALGENDFVATTTTVAGSEFNVSKFNTNNTSEEDKLAENKSKVPYAVYNGGVYNEDVTGVNDFVTIPMTTENGRINTVVRMDDSIENDYTLEVLVYTFNNAPTIKSVTGNKSVSIYWSADDSVEGQVLTIQIKLIAENGFVAYETLEEQVVIGSTGINTLYTVFAGSVQSESTGFDFVFEPWTEIDNDNQSLCDDVTTQNISGSYSLTQDTTFESSNLVISGDLNLNGFALNVPCGSITVSGHLNGGGSVNYCSDLTVAGNIQNNPTITNDCN